MSDSKPIILPAQGVARVKSVMSGDTVVLLGKPTEPNQVPPEVVFTFESLSSPRLASKSTPNDEPGAFEAREWLRKLVVGKAVRFETRKQGASAGDRVYGWLFLEKSGEEPKHLAVECVRAGYATPKSLKYGSGADDSADKDASAEDDYESKLKKAYKEAQDAGRGIHDTTNPPSVRTLKNAGDDFAILALVESCKKVANKRIKCVIEHVFDGSRFRCQVTDPSVPTYQYASFTLLLAGVTCPRSGNPSANPPTESEPFADQARQFVTARLLQREMDISLLGTDKNSVNAVGTVHHPAGNIAIELLKNGYARITDWSVRLMPTSEVPALRFAENAAKRTNVGVWKDYAPPKLSTASQLRGTVVEVLSGDTLLILPEGKAYDSESALLKVSLASVRAPRVGSTYAGREDEPYSVECKNRLIALTVGQQVVVDVHYERDIPTKPNETEKRPFGTVSVGSIPDVAEVLISEGFAVTQRHRDEDEKSPRYDELRAAEVEAKEKKRGINKDGEYKKGGINDLTEPRKAKAYSGSLMRSKKQKAVVEYVFNGALFKLYVPSENCYIRFSPSAIRCPQPSPSPGSKSTKPAEPFGDEAKLHARLTVLQRSVEIECTGVTNGGIILGNMFLGPAKQDYTLDLVGKGLATVDQRKIDYGEAPMPLVNAQDRAREGKIGIWSIERPTPEKDENGDDSNDQAKEQTLTVQMSEIRAGNHIFYHIKDDERIKVVDDSMKLFTETNGTDGAPCDVKVGKVVAALFDDGTGKRWYRAKITEKKSPTHVSVLFIDYGNIATVPVATHLRPLDDALETDKIPPVAHEAVLAFVQTRPLTNDEGIEAAQLLNSMCWGKDLTIKTFAPDDNGKMAVALSIGSEETINKQLVAEGLARAPQQRVVNIMARKLSGDSSSLVKLAAELQKAQENARQNRLGMWRYGDVGDDDPDEI